MRPKASVPQQNPFLTTMAMNGLNQSNSLLQQGPVTSLPTNMQSNVQFTDAVGQGLQGDAMLPRFLQLSTRNPLLAQADTPQKIAQTYGDKVFDYSIRPQLGEAAIGQWLGGNLGTSGSSTFGANYLSNLEGSGRIQSFFKGQEYYDDLLNNMLNMRNNLFGNNILPALDTMQFNQSQNSQNLGMLNNFRLNQAQGIGNNAMSALGWANQQQDRQMMANQANAMNRANLISGIGGLIGGGIGAIGGKVMGGLRSLGGSMGGGMGSMPSLKPFPQSSFATSLGNY